MAKIFMIHALIWGMILVEGALPVLAAPPPDHPTVDQAARILEIPTQPPRHQGRLLEIFDSNNYSYMRVSHPQEQERWLAAPRTPLTVGTRIRYGEGKRMDNFYSKVWQRTFPVIYFVGEVVIESEP
ncbi:MAG: hypothetical protein G8237_13485 [Magnetococcales bacterium]|nr:hypothetical protein [Magnetococcales bacterium]